MKRTLLLMYLLLTPMVVAHAQTAEESSAWLQARLRSYDLVPQLASMETVSITGILSYGDYQEMDGQYTTASRTYIRFANVTDITYRFQQGQVSGNSTTYAGYFISLTGPSKQIQSGMENPVDHITLSLRPDTPKEEVDRMIKAIKHLAILNGAKLPSDDLFK